MTQETLIAKDSKSLLLDKIKKIQAKIDTLDAKRMEKILSLAKKHQLQELDEAILKKEFAVIQAKYASEALEDHAKKNSSN